MQAKTWENNTVFFSCTLVMLHLLCTSATRLKCHQGFLIRQAVLAFITSVNFNFLLLVLVIVHLCHNSKPVRSFNFPGPDDQRLTSDSRDFHDLIRTDVLKLSQHSVIVDRVSLTSNTASIIPDIHSCLSLTVWLQEWNQVWQHHGSIIVSILYFHQKIPFIQLSQNLSRRNKVKDYDFSEEVTFL